MTKRDWLRRVLLTLGILICLYPFASRAMVAIHDRIQIGELRRDKADQEKRAAALAKLEGNKFAPTFTTKNLDKDMQQQVLGSITLPTLQVGMLLFDNISEDALNRGAGVLHGGSAPTGGRGTHAVISAHSGLPGKEFFSRLHKMKKGDRFVITVGERKLAYAVDAKFTVEPHDVSQLHIDPNRDLVTLLTCTPVPLNTHRLLVRGHRVPYTAELSRVIKVAQRRSDWRNGVILVIVTLALLGLLWLIWRRKKRQAVD